MPKPSDYPTDLCPIDLMFQALPAIARARIMSALLSIPPCQGPAFFRNETRIAYAALMAKNEREKTNV